MYTVINPRTGEETIIGERYYVLFGEKGYIVLDSKKNHEIVFKGKRNDVNGKEAKKWALEHNKAEVKNKLNEIF